MDKTENVYGFLWSKGKRTAPSHWHFNDMQSVIPESIVRGAIGVEVGSGCGYDTYIMAKDNPLVKIVSLDISNGVYATRQMTSGMKNAWVIKASGLRIPLKDNSADFAYSYGVLHHFCSPGDGLKEIARVIQKGAPAFIYLYERHSDNFLKYCVLKIVSLLRCITTKLSSRTLYIISRIFSPLAFVLFSVPAKILSRFRLTRLFSKKVPFAFGTHPFSLTADLYDRFAAPIEYRFNKKEVFDLFDKAGFININTTKIRGRAGWVAWGYKNND